MPDTTRRYPVLTRPDADTKPEDKWWALAGRKFTARGLGGHTHRRENRAEIEAELSAQSFFQDPDLTLEPVDPRLESGQLGLQVLLRQPLLDRIEPLLDLVEPPLHSFEPRLHPVEAALDAVQPLLDPLQPGNEHVVLGLEPVEALVDGVEVRVQPSEPLVHLEAEVPHDPLYVGKDHLPVEPGQDRNEIVGHVPYRTSRPAPSGPPSRPSPRGAGPHA
jgi:hypothetical protein